jgi:hypothetical protein
MVGEAELRRLARFKSIERPSVEPLGNSMISFFKQSVAKRTTKLGKISEHWAALVPETLSAHCALDSLHRNSLTVLVDSSSHLYELKQLLLAGLEQQLLIACKSTGLRKISLKPGRWRDTGADERKSHFA